MHNRFSVLLFFVICLTSCREPVQFSDTYKTKGFWHKDSIAEFSFTAPDTINKYDFFIHIRNTEDYKFSNLFLITSMQFPHGKIIVDTLEYKMAFKDGRLMGEGFGSIKDNKLWYKEALKFSENGEYQIKIRHAMRKANRTESLKTLKGIEEIGFSFEPVKPENDD